MLHLIATMQVAPPFRPDERFVVLPVTVGAEFLELAADLVLLRQAYTRVFRIDRLAEPMRLYSYLPDPVAQLAAASDLADLDFEHDGYAFVDFQPAQLDDLPCRECPDTVGTVCCIVENDSYILPDITLSWSGTPRGSTHKHTTPPAPLYIWEHVLLGAPLPTRTPGRMEATTSLATTRQFKTRIQHLAFQPSG